jgi:hypothetical protein
VTGVQTCALPIYLPQGCNALPDFIRALKDRQARS